jgi:hypothetical protein
MNPVPQEALAFMLEERPEEMDDTIPDLPEPALV